MYKTVLFDLDGTLTDPGEGITNSVAYALKKWGIEVEDRTTLYRFIGPPLMESFSRFYGFGEDDCRAAVRAYREYYAQRGIFENRLYPGMDALLARIRASGREILLATSKPEAFARQILEYFHIDEYFTLIAGASMDETRSTKAQVIAYALEQHRVDVREAVMVGDREHDVLGAAAFGIDCIGVLFGYGSEEELRAAGAKYIAPTVEDIFPLL